MPWKNVTYPEAAKIMKTALEQGANFWNGVSTLQILDDWILSD